ncbi:hypothetical protein CsSME_00029868 [Camellia sinensis var. sinensis]
MIVGLALSISPYIFFWRKSGREDRSKGKK